MSLGHEREGADMTEKRWLRLAAWPLALTAALALTGCISAGKQPKTLLDRLIGVGDAGHVDSVSRLQSA